MEMKIYLRQKMCGTKFTKNIDPLIIFTNYFLPKMKKINGEDCYNFFKYCFGSKEDTRPWFSGKVCSNFIMKSLSKNEFARNGITFNTILDQYLLKYWMG